MSIGRCRRDLLTSQFKKIKIKINSAPTFNPLSKIKKKKNQKSLTAAEALATEGLEDGLELATGVEALFVGISTPIEAQV